MRAPVLGLTLALLTFTACKESWTLGDGDGDGVLVTDGDCDDNDPEVNPGASEVWYNGVDENCDGLDADKDGDGYVDDAYVAAFPDWQTRFPLHAGLSEGDCWDDPDDGAFLEAAVGDGLTLTPDLVSPGAEDAWYDGVDQDCGGENDFDQDGDGFLSANDEQADGSVGDDCVDGSANDEVFEDSCSGELITVDPADAATINPAATDTFYDGIDQNCDGADDNDADGDGYAVCNECDDTDPDTFPSDIPEVWYDCQDQNCDGNDGDRDGDGYVDADYTATCADWETINPGKDDGDCWDDITDNDPDYSAINGNPKLSQADVHPDAEDIPYDAVDAACDGDTYEFDADQDGFDSDSEPNRAGVRGDDCHDDVAAAYPGATEECDSADIDHDCDGDLNDPSALGCVTFYTDADKDTYGTTSSQCLCEAEGTYTSSNNDDCDDTDKTVNPAATEGVGDSEDQNCDGAESCYTDADNDGYRDSASTILTSTDSDCNDSGEATASDGTGDCADSNSAINPGASEVCDASNTDEDCDGKADNDDLPSTGTTRYYKDADSDTYGDSSDSGSLLCDASTTYKVTNKTDCNDSNSSINTAATEIAGDEVDQNCNGTETCFADADNDGYRPNTTSTVSSSDTDCTDSGEAKSSEPTTDCDDTNANRNPGKTEVCDSSNTDEDCDGLADNDDLPSTGTTRYYKDADSDTFGDETDAGSLLCDVTSTYKVTTNTDCNDASSAIKPGATEISGDEIDQNCDDAETCFLDNDDDGYRPDSTSTRSSTDLDCTDSKEAKSSDPTGDCNDSSASINPGATETIGDGADQNCDNAETCYVDADNDGYRPDSTSTVASADADCSDSGEALSTEPTGDCADSNATRYPGNTEVVGDGRDSDCDLQEICYIDADNDGFILDSGTVVSTDTDCADSGEGTSTDGTGDCDDTDISVNPDADDQCNDGLDDDCDDIVDEGGASACYAAGDLVITEIMFFGSAVADPAGEWFEVYNDTADTIYMQSMKVTRNHNTNGNQSFYVGTDIHIDAGQYAVFCYSISTLGLYSASAPSNKCDYFYGSSNGFSSSWGATFNSSFLLTQNASSTIVITAQGSEYPSVDLDSVNYNGASSASPWPGGTTGYSYELGNTKRDATSNDTGAHWCNADAASVVFSTDRGTPRAVNVCSK